MAKRKYGGSITVEVDVEEYEVISQISDEALREEAESRGITLIGSKCDVPEMWRDFADDLRASSAGGDRIHFEVLIVRMMALAGVPRMVIPKKDGAKVGA